MVFIKPQIISLIIIKVKIIKKKIVSDKLNYKNDDRLYEVFIKAQIISLLQINIFLMFLDHFDVLMLKIIFKK